MAAQPNDLSVATTGDPAQPIAVRMVVTYEGRNVTTSALLSEAKVAWLIMSLTDMLHTIQQKKVR